MKKIYSLLFLLTSLTALAQNEVAEDTTAKPAITEKGKPDGEKTEMKMGKEGGTLASSDGKLELIIPSGALAKKTNISIQPVTNLMPNGNGKAYSLEPSGIRFQQPAQIIFHYVSEEIKDSTQLLMGIATQDDNGQWYGLKDFTLDTIAKTLTGNISHFSTWSDFEKLKIHPSYKRKKVDTYLYLEVNWIEDEKNSDNPSTSTKDDDLSPLRAQKIRAAWSVNGIPSGNSIVGTIYAPGPYKMVVIYHAPALVPERDPVEVAAKLQGITYKYKGTTFKDLRLVSNILVFDDAYQIVMTSQFEGDAGTVLGKSTYKDIGTFVVSIEKGKARIIEKENYNSIDDFGYKGCACTLINKGANHGLIHITGVKSIILNPAKPPGQPYATVVIEFIQVPVSMSSLSCDCPGHKKGFVTPSILPFPAFPRIVMFEVKKGSQDNLRGSVDIPGLKFNIHALQVEEISSF